MDAVKDAVEGTGYHPDLSPEQLRAVKHIRARKMMRTEDTMNMNSFGTDAIGGLVPNLARGALGLKKQEAPTTGRITAVTGGVNGDVVDEKVNGQVNEVVVA
jgi:hypothetical protein